MNKTPDIRAVICNALDAESSFAERIRSSFPSAAFDLFASDRERNALLDGCREKDLPSKSVLLLDRFKGRLIQKCPATKGMICCNYRLINSGFNCVYSCTYCYLQSYLNSYGILLFTNEEEILAGCGEFISGTDPSFAMRIGTGEFTDSLMIDQASGLSRILIEKFAPHRHLFLELKTKSSNIDHLLSIADKGSAVASWSVNSPRIIAEAEEGAASLYDRLEAASRAAAAGFWVAFHFDPVVLYEGWQRDYDEVVGMIFSRVPAGKILWISLGGFRFTPQFKDIMRTNFPSETLSDGEFVPCPDGKMRYPKPLRREIYTFMKDSICRRSDAPFVYMCMESADMWESVFGRSYGVSEDLEADFALFLKNKLSAHSAADK
jgi:spore photoproduct lyase